MERTKRNKDISETGKNLNLPKTQVNKEIPKEEIQIIDTPQAPLWRKIGGGSFRFGNRIIKPNQTFYAYEEEIPMAFRQCIIRVSSVNAKEIESKGELKKVELLFSRQSIPDNPGFYNVVNSVKRAINKEPLTEEQAIALTSSLNNEI